MVALREISRMGISGLDAEELGLRFLELVRKHVPFDRGAVRPVDGTTGDLVGGVAIGVGSEIPLPAERNVTMAQAIALGRSVINPESDPEDPDPAGPLSRLGELKLNASVSFPLLADEAVVGMSRCEERAAPVSRPPNSTSSAPRRSRLARQSTTRGSSIQSLTSRRLSRRLRTSYVA
jgi:hypothetical protein